MEGFNALSAATHALLLDQPKSVAIKRRRTEEKHYRCGNDGRRVEVRYRPVSACELILSGNHDVLYKGVKAGKHRYEYLTYVDTKEEKEVWLKSKQAEFQRLKAETTLIRMRECGTTQLENHGDVESHRDFSVASADNKPPPPLELAPSFDFLASSFRLSGQKSCPPTSRSNSSHRWLLTVHLSQDPSSGGFGFSVARSLSGELVVDFVAPSFISHEGDTPTLRLGDRVLAIKSVESNVLDCSPTERLGKEGLGGRNETGWSSGGAMSNHAEEWTPLSAVSELWGFIEGEYANNSSTTLALKVERVDDVTLDTSPPPPPTHPPAHSSSESAAIVAMSSLSAVVSVGPAAASTFRVPPRRGLREQSVRSQYKGVTYYRGSLTGRHWEARFRPVKKGQSVHLGYFETEEEAARQHDLAAGPLGQEVNFPSATGQKQATKYQYPRTQAKDEGAAGPGGADKKAQPTSCGGSMHSAAQEPQPPVAASSFGCQTEPNSLCLAKLRYMPCTAASIVGTSPDWNSNSVSHL